MFASGLSVAINFQPGGSAVPAGHRIDYGQAFKDHQNGFAYGWGADNLANTRQRNSANSPDQRYDTLNHMQLGGVNHTWELAVPNGAYSVRVVAGDPDYTGQVMKINAEAATVINGTTTTAQRFLDATATVTVSDGRLTLSNPLTTTDNKLCFVYVNNAADAAAAPAAPSGMVAQLGAPDGIHLRFNDNATGEVSHRIERATSAAGPFAEIASVWGNAEWYSNPGLSLNTTYHYRTRAVNAAGTFSAYSNVASATTLASSTNVQQAYGGTPRALPGTVEAEDYDIGGQGTAYYDASTGVNLGGEYRGGSVDVGYPGVLEGGYHVGWTVATEYAEYTVNVPTAGTYRLDARVSSDGAGGTFHVEFNGVDKTGTMTAPDTGGWATYATVSKPVTLSAGVQVMRLKMDSVGASGSVANCNWVRVSQVPREATRLTATAVSSSQINLNWTDDSTDETGFRVERNLGGGTFATVATLGPNVTNFAVTGLAASFTGIYRVTAFNGSGSAAPSNEAAATTFAATGTTYAGPAEGDHWIYRVTVGTPQSNTAMGHQVNLAFDNTWKTAPSAEAAVLGAISGYIKALSAGTVWHGGQNKVFNFPGGAFRQGALVHDAANERYTGTINFEDLTGDPQNDSDFNDRAWPVTVDYAYIVGTAWEAIDSPVTPNTGNGRPGSAVGLKMFPDFTSYTDTIDRGRVRLKATLNRPVYGVPIYFRDVDVDDPSASQAPLDDEMQENDNIALGSFESSSASATGGVASVVYNISRAPGDNIVGVAALSPAYLGRLRNVDAAGDGLEVYVYDGGARGLPVLPNQKAQPLLAKRVINVEVDSMTIETPYNFPGDDTLRGNLVDPNIDALAEAFGDADIEVKKAAAPVNNSDTPWFHDFVGNLAGMHDYFLNANTGQRGSRDKQGFITAYVCEIYENGSSAAAGAQDPSDNDLNNEIGGIGVSRRDPATGVWFSTTHAEVRNDLVGQYGWNAAQIARVEQAVALHEIGHQFELDHHSNYQADGKTPTDVMWGPGKDGDEANLPATPLNFSDTQIDALKTSFALK